MRLAPTIDLTPDEVSDLKMLVARGTTPQQIVDRASVVLLAARGWTNQRIARRVGMGRVAVGRWRSRFEQQRVPGILHDRPGRGRKRKYDKERVAEVIRLTQGEVPRARTHWSRSSMARATGISESSVGRIWRDNGLKPHRIETFKLSKDPDFEAKLVDIIGLYSHPPEHAVVFSVDEKSGTQALDRTQPGLPLKKGRAGTMTHDYKRNGTTTLFAALNVLTGLVVGKCMPQHTHVEWLAFLKQLDQMTPAELELHVIADNLATHKHPKVRRWLKRHPRVRMHFTPTSSSWLNMVERFFRDITENAIRRGVFRNVDALIGAIDDYVAVHNLAPKPFIWTANAKDILEKVRRARRVIDDRQIRTPISGGVH
jgi:transposase